MDKEQFDFWYAVNNTRIVVKPRQSLETFGTTTLKYHLVSELMDAINQIRIREGTIKAGRPQIITPSQSEDILDGFADDEAREYVKWLKSNEHHLKILQYGFVITKQEISEEVVSNPLDAVVESIEADVRRRDDPHSAVLIGVDKPWEVCLLKLLKDVVTDSAPDNLNDLMQHQLSSEARARQALRQEIELEFQAAARNPSRVTQLGDKLQRHNLFAEYEDRFFALVQSHKS